MRQWHNVSFNGFYTYSQTMTSVQLQNNTTQGLAQNYTNLAAEYGRADTDQRHVFSINLNWEIDYYQGDNGVLARARSTAGASRRSSSCAAACRSPSPTATSTPTSTARPTTGRSRSAIRTSTTRRRQMWFNTAAFVQNKVVTGAPVDGNTPRNSLEGPGLPRRRPGHLARLPAAQGQADVPRRGDQRVQHRELRAAGRQRAVGRDLDHVRRHPQRQGHAPGAARRALDVLRIAATRASARVRRVPAAEPRSSASGQASDVEGRQKRSSCQPRHATPSREGVP